MNCPYCGVPARLERGSVVYPRRLEKGRQLFWYCAPCRAWTPCRPGTRDPAGRIADAGLRDLQQRARQASWNIENTLMAVHRISREASRVKVVEKLSRHMRLPVPECDIGLLDPQQCLAAINFFKSGAR